MKIIEGYNIRNLNPVLNPITKYLISAVLNQSKGSGFLHLGISRLPFDFHFLNIRVRTFSSTDSYSNRWINCISSLIRSRFFFINIIFVISLAFFKGINHFTDSVQHTSWHFSEPYFSTKNPRYHHHGPFSAFRKALRWLAIIRTSVISNIRTIKLMQNNITGYAILGNKK